MTHWTLRARPHDTSPGGSVTELCLDDGRNDDTLLLAPHGGLVEPGTTEAVLAAALESPSLSAWTAAGFHDEGAFDAWHGPSTELSPGQFGFLDDLRDREFDVVIAVHGWSEDGALVGGGAGEELRGDVEAALDALGVEARRATPADDYRGVHPENVVNEVAVEGRGVQLELGWDVRSDRGALVEALVAFAEARSRNGG